MRPGSPTRHAFIDAVLAELDAGKSLRTIHLRDIARQIGCAHTNAYNWFQSQEGLYWFALGAALERLIDPIRDRPPADLPGPEAAGGLFDLYIEFAAGHPNWFRLIWMEELSGDPPAEVQESLRRPPRLMWRWLRHHAPPTLTDQRLEEVSRIVHGYLQGELSTRTSLRADPNAPENSTTAISSRVRRLYRILVEEAARVAAPGPLFNTAPPPTP